MDLIIQYWDLILIIFIVLTGFGLYIYNFFTKPSAERREKIRVWLLDAVLLAENSYKNGTGKFKFSMVYDLFIQRFKWIAIFMPKSVFEELVDDTLTEMKHFLETNDNIATLLKKGND